MDDASAIDEVFEMANLPESKTGIPGVIYISTRQGAHAPRVKYFQKAGGTQPSLSVSIEAEPRLLVSSLPERVTNQFFPFVSAWVRVNADALLSFWNEGDTWLDDQVTEFKGRLQKAA